jgi:hypothetical protein
MFQCSENSGTDRVADTPLFIAVYFSLFLFFLRVLCVLCGERFLDLDCVQAARFARSAMDSTRYMERTTGSSINSPSTTTRPVLSC